MDLIGKCYKFGVKSVKVLEFKCKEILHLGVVLKIVEFWEGADFQIWKSF